MQCDVSIRKALGLPRLIEWVLPGHAAIHRQENVLSFRCLREVHVIPQPTLQPAALIIIGACTLGIIFCSALKAIHIKLTHIGSDFFKVFNELTIGHAGTLLSS